MCNYVTVARGFLENPKLKLNLNPKPIHSTKEIEIVIGIWKLTFYVGKLVLVIELEIGSLLIS